MSNALMRIPLEYVAVPRAVCAKWWPQPYSALRAAAEAGMDGLSVHLQPKMIVGEGGKAREVDDYPFRVRGAMTFYEAGVCDGYRREDVASLHAQGW